MLECRPSYIVSISILCCIVIEHLYIFSAWIQTKCASAIFEAISRCLFGRGNMVLILNSSMFTNSIHLGLGEGHMRKLKGRIRT